VSSAYVNSNKNYAMEKIYDAPANYNDIINYVQTMDTEKLNSAAEKLVIKLIFYKIIIKYFKISIQQLYYELQIIGILMLILIIAKM